MSLGYLTTGGSSLPRIAFLSPQCERGEPVLELVESPGPLLQLAVEQREVERVRQAVDGVPHERDVERLDDGVVGDSQGARLREVAFGDRAGRAGHLLQER